MIIITRNREVWFPMWLFRISWMAASETCLIFSIIVEVGTGPLFLCLICLVVSLTSLTTHTW